MKNNELRKKSIDELKKEMQALLQELFNLRMQRGMGQVARPHVFKQARRNIARIKTILQEKARS